MKAANAAQQQIIGTSAAEPATERDSIRLIYKPELLQLIGVSYGSIFAWMRTGKFPLAREIGPGGRSTRIAWVEREILDWLAVRPKRHIRPPPIAAGPAKDKGAPPPSAPARDGGRS
jgi:predicted DNA-binding transcriptional regulator AlpA